MAYQPMTNEEDENIRKAMERVKALLVTRINRELLCDSAFSASALESTLSDDMWLRLVVFLDTQLLDRVKYVNPRTWWDAFKLRFFPPWLQKQFPINYELTVIEARAYNSAIIGRLKDRGFEARLVVNARPDLSYNTEDQE